MAGGFGGGKIGGSCFYDTVLAVEVLTCLFSKTYSAVTVDGRLESRKFTDKQGNERKTVEIIADNVFFGDSKNEQQKTGFTQVCYSFD